MKTLISVIFFALLFHASATAQYARVSGNAATYAGDSLNIYQESDCISGKKINIARVAVSQSGDFSFSVKISSETRIFFDLTVFEGILYLRPSSNLTVVLPKKQNIRPEDEINPFFQKQPFYVNCPNASPSDLNRLIPEFDNLYTNALDKILYSPYDVGKKRTDSLESIIRSRFITTDEFFNNYMFYRFAQLDYTSWRRSKTDIAKQCFYNKPVLTNNPAYVELFKEIFQNPFTSGAASVVGVKGLISCMYDRSYTRLQKILTTDKRFENQRFADFVILKGLYDSYFADTFPPETVIAVIDSFSMNSTQKDFRITASSIKDDFTRLYCGIQPPDFRLADKDGIYKSLNDFSGKFVYLHFFNPLSYTALTDLELLKTIRANYKSDVLEIVTIFVSSDKNEYIKFINENPDCNWPVLWYADNKTLLQDYDVSLYPLYYLIDPDSKLLMKPAPSPQEKFESEFESALRNRRINQSRQNNGSQTNNSLQSGY